MQRYDLYGSIKNSRNMKILSCNNTIKLAKAISYDIGLKVINRDISRFSDGEISIKIKDDLYQKDVLIIHQVYPSVNENLLQLLFLINAAKKAGAKRVHAIIPYFAYSRMDHKNNDYDFISASCLASLLESAGLETLITIDLHSSQIEGFFRISVKNITMLELFKDYFSANTKKNAVIVSPDIGGKLRSINISKYMGIHLAVIYKQRDEENHITMNGIMGDVKGKDCIIVDDIMGSGQTIINAIEVLSGAGVNSIEVVVTHNLMDMSNSNMLKLLSNVSSLTISNSVPLIQSDTTYSAEVNVIDISKPIIKFIKSYFL